MRLRFPIQRVLLEVIHKISNDFSQIIYDNSVDIAQQKANTTGTQNAYKVPK